LFLLDSEYAESEALDSWLEQSRSQIDACAGNLGPLT